MTEDEKKKDKPNLKYEPDDPGPFKVNITFEDEINKNKDLTINDLQVGQDLTKCGFTNFTKVVRVSRKVVTLTLDSAESANALIENAQFALKYRAYLIRGFLFVDGFLPCPSEMNFDGVGGIKAQILENNKHFNIVEVKQLIRKNTTNTSEEKNNSTNVAITFRRKILPGAIKIFGIKKKIFPFTHTPKLCNNCGFYGHDAEKCNHKTETFCSNCFRRGHKTCDETFCKHCKSTTHKIDSLLCPERLRQSKISKVMVRKNVGFNKAKQVFTARLNPPNPKNQKAFPNLPKPTNSAHFKITSQNPPVEQFLTPYLQTPINRMVGNKKRPRSKNPSQQMNDFQRNPGHFTPEPFNANHLTSTSYASTLKNDFQSNSSNVPDIYIIEFNKFLSARLPFLVKQLFDEFMTMSQNNRHHTDTLESSPESMDTQSSHPPLKTIRISAQTSNQTDQQ